MRVVLNNNGGAGSGAVEVEVYEQYMHTRQSHEFKEGSLFPCTTLSFVFREFIHSPIQTENWESIGAHCFVRRMEVENVCAVLPFSPSLGWGYTRDRE